MWVNGVTLTVDSISIFIFKESTVSPQTTSVVYFLWKLIQETCKANNINPWKRRIIKESYWIIPYNVNNLSSLNNSTSTSLSFVLLIYIKSIIRTPSVKGNKAVQYLFQTTRQSYFLFVKYLILLVLLLKHGTHFYQIIYLPKVLHKKYTIPECFISYTLST